MRHRTLRPSPARMRNLCHWANYCRLQKQSQFCACNIQLLVVWSFLFSDTLLKPPFNHEVQVVVGRLGGRSPKGNPTSSIFPPISHASLVAILAFPPEQTHAYIGQGRACNALPWSAKPGAYISYVCAHLIGWYRVVDVAGRPERVTRVCAHRSRIGLVVH